MILLEEEEKKKKKKTMSRSFNDAGDFDALILVFFQTHLTGFESKMAELYEM